MLPSDHLIRIAMLSGLLLSGLHIHHKSPVPLYGQVEALLRDMIKEARYQNGELLPPEARIAEQLFRGYGGIPAVRSVSWFHSRAGLSLDDDFGLPLYDLVHAQCGIIRVCSEEEVSAALADKSLADDLKCDAGDPILVRIRSVSDASRQRIEYNENHYRADRFTYGLTIRRERK